MERPSISACKKRLELLMANMSTMPYGSLFLVICNRAIRLLPVNLLNFKLTVLVS